MRKKIIATSLQAAGMLAIAAGVGLASIWGGIVTLGIGLIAFGIAVERDNA